MNGQSNEVSEEVILYDYSALLEQILEEQIEVKAEIQQQNQQLRTANTFLSYACGFLLFFVVVTLCVYGYKFIRLFI